MGQLWVVAGALSGCMAVAAGAFGAHALKARLGAEALGWWHTGAQYQMYHALALLAYGVWAGGAHCAASSPPVAFLAGTVLFSGSLYIMALTGVRWLGAVTPVGGLAFLAGWLGFAWLAWKASSKHV